MDISGGFRGGSRGSLEPPSGPKLFYFPREFQKILCEIRVKHHLAKTRIHLAKFHTSFGQIKNLHMAK